MNQNSNGSGWEIGAYVYKESGSVCGDATQDVGEECDDGNVLAADGCSPTCTLEPCVAAPVPSCLEAAEAQLYSSEKTVGKERLRLRWKKATAATTQAAFGNPATGTTRVALCLYDDGGSLIAHFVVDQGGQSCGGKPCWRAKNTTGFAYQDKAVASDGIGNISYSSGDANRGKVDVAGWNSASRGQIALPTGVVAALSGNTSPIAQLVTSDGLCLGATLSDVTRDDGLQYKARRKGRRTFAHRTRYANGRRCGCARSPEPYAAVRVGIFATSRASRFAASQRS